MQKQVAGPRWAARLALRVQSQEPYIALPALQEKKIETSNRYNTSESIRDNKSTSVREVKEQHSLLSIVTAQEQVSRSPRSPRKVLSFCSENTVFDFPVPPSPSITVHSRPVSRISTSMFINNPKHLSSSTASSMSSAARSRPRRGSDADTALPQLLDLLLPAVTSDAQDETLPGLEESLGSDTDTLCSSMSPSAVSVRFSGGNTSWPKPPKALHPAFRKSFYPMLTMTSPDTAKRLGVPSPSEVEIWTDDSDSDAKEAD